MFAVVRVFTTINLNDMAEPKKAKSTNAANEEQQAPEKLDTRTKTGRPYPYFDPTPAARYAAEPQEAESFDDDPLERKMREDPAWPLFRTVSDMRAVSTMSVKTICREIGVDYNDFAKFMYRHGDRAQSYFLLGWKTSAILMMDDVLDLVDDTSRDLIEGPMGQMPNMAAVNRDKLRAETRKFMSSKMLPRLFGEKVDIHHTGEIKKTSIHIHMPASRLSGHAAPPSHEISGQVERPSALPDGNPEQDDEPEPGGAVEDSDEDIAQKTIGEDFITIDRVMPRHRVALPEEDARRIHTADLQIRRAKPSELPNDGYLRSGIVETYAHGVYKDQFNKMVRDLKMSEEARMSEDREACENSVANQIIAELNSDPAKKAELFAHRLLHDCPDRLQSEIRLTRLGRMSDEDCYGVEPDIEAPWRVNDCEEDYPLPDSIPAWRQRST